MKTIIYPRLLKSLIFIGLFSLALVSKTNAQEGAYWMGLSTKNPAAIGTPSDWVFASYNFAKLGNDDKLSGFIGSADFEISPRIGSAGITVIQEKLYNETTSQYAFQYAYTMVIEENGELSLGLSIGTTKFEQVLTTYNYYNEDMVDPSFQSPGNPNAKYLKSSLGIFYNSFKFDIGLSYNFDKELENNLSQNNNYSINPTKNFMTAVGAYRFIIEEKFNIEPNLMFDFYKGNTDTHSGLFFKYNDFIWAGYNNLNFEKIHSIMVGADIVNRLRVGYSITFSKLFDSDYSKIHEFVLGFRLN